MQYIIVHPTVNRWQRTEANKNEGLQIRPDVQKAGKLGFTPTSKRTECRAKPTGWA